MVHDGPILSPVPRQVPDLAVEDQRQGLALALGSDAPSGTPLMVIFAPPKACP